MIKKILYHLTHNIIANNIIILFGLENSIKSSNKMWLNYNVDKNKTLQEAVGFSHLPDVEEALKKAHSDLVQLAKDNLKPGASVLDIGCGTGLYLKDFDRMNFNLCGIDMSEGMINTAKQYLPDVGFYIGDFMKTNFKTKFDLIYSVSVLEYIARNDLEAHFKKLHENSNDHAVIFIHYPHALSLKDTLYPDLNYIKYSPAVIEKAAGKYFSIIRHDHCFDNRIVKKYDTKIYPSKRGTFKNGYVLIARKKARVMI